MKYCHIDFETASLLDLAECGLDNYTKHPSTKVLLMAYAFDDEPIQLWESHKSSIPVKVRYELLNPWTIKVAWNVPFERNVLWHVLGIKLPWEHFFDTMVRARYLSLPGELGECGEALDLPMDKAKLKEGVRLLKRFTEPYSRGRATPMFGYTPPEFHGPDDSPNDWKLFCQYCRQDVEAERAIMHQMKNFPLPEREHHAWCLDQRINEAGLPINLNFVNNAFALANRRHEELEARVKVSTQLENPNSPKQMLKWARGQGYPYNSVEKSSITRALKVASGSISPLGQEILALRRELGRTSYKKFEKIKNQLSPDGRLRHQFLFMGAARTGRWSGKGPQVHNLPRPDKAVSEKYELAIELIEKNNYETITKEFEVSVVDVVVSCIRSSFQAPLNRQFAVCDSSAIENRVLGYVSGCTAISEVFRKGLDPYIDFGTKMYKVAYELITKNQRQISKPAVLGAGYGLSGGEEEENEHGDLIKTGLWGYAEAMNIEMTREEAHIAVRVFRKSYPEIVEFWALLEAAALKVLEEGGTAKVGFVRFFTKKLGEKIVLCIELPSGRCLHYLNARIQMRWNRQAIVYDGIGHGAGMIQEGWGPVFTWGGKICENIVQAVSRDILLNSMFLADKITGLLIVGHFHDEILAETSEGQTDRHLAALRSCMSMTPEWAPGLLLAADGYVDKYYRKG